MASDVTVKMHVRIDDPKASYVTDLPTLHLRELRNAMSGRAFALDATGLSAANVTFWTAWADNTLLGFRALKELTDVHGEVKSMRTAPEVRDKGVGAPCSTVPLAAPVCDGAMVERCSQRDTSA